MKKRIIPSYNNSYYNINNNNIIVLDLLDNVHNDCYPWVWVWVIRLL